MAKSSRIGERNARIIIKKLIPGTDADCFATETWEAVFLSPVWCKWADTFGQSLYENERSVETGIATINMAYTPLVTNRCRVWKFGDAQDDAHAYAIIGEPNNVDRKELEFKVRRVVSA